MARSLAHCGQAHANGLRVPTSSPGAAEGETHGVRSLSSASQSCSGLTDRSCVSVRPRRRPRRRLGFGSPGRCGAGARCATYLEIQHPADDFDNEVFTRGAVPYRPSPGLLQRPETRPVHVRLPTRPTAVPPAHDRPGQAVGEHLRRPLRHVDDSKATRPRAAAQVPWTLMEGPAASSWASSRSPSAGTSRTRSARRSHRDRAPSQAQGCMVAALISGASSPSLLRTSASRVSTSQARVASWEVVYGFPPDRGFVTGSVGIAHS